MQCVQAMDEHTASHKRAMAGLEGSLASLTAAKAAADSGTAEVRGKRDELQQQVQDLRQQAEQAAAARAGEQEERRKEWQLLERQQAEAAEKLQAARAEGESRAAEVTSWRERAEGLQAELEAAKAAAKEEAGALQAQARAAEQEAGERAAALEERLAAASGAGVAAERKRDTLQEQLADARSRLTAAEGAAEDLRKRVDAAEAKAARLNRQADEAATAHEEAVAGHRGQAEGAKLQAAQQAAAGEHGRALGERNSQLEALRTQVSAVAVSQQARVVQAMVGRARLQASPGRNAADHYSAPPVPVPTCHVRMVMEGRHVVVPFLIANQSTRRRRWACCKPRWSTCAAPAAPSRAGASMARPRWRP